MAEQYPYIPQFKTFLPPYNPGEVATPTRQLPAEVPATGTGNWFTSGVMSGFHSAVSEGARALQAVSQVAGAPGAAQYFSESAEAAHARGQEYARPDLEANPWSLPGIGYQVARMVPVGAATVGGGLLAAATAPEVAAGATAAAVAAAGRAAFVRGLAGATAATYPFAAGANVQRQISETGELTTPGKALAWGVPEAVVQGYLPARLETLFGKGLVRGVGGAAGIQGVAEGATEAMTQQLGDPNRSMADRAAAIGHATLTGAALGGIIGGAHHGVRSLVGKPAQTVSTEDLSTSVDQALEPPKQLEYRPSMGPPLHEVPIGEIAGRIDTLQREPKQTQASVEELRLLIQEQQRREAAAAEAEAAKPPPQLLLPAPPVKAGPPLGDMSPTELWTRFNKVNEHLTYHPDDPGALQAFEMLGQEYTRRAAEMPPAPPVPEPPRQLEYRPAMGAPLHEVPIGEIAGRIDILQREPPRTQAQAEELRQLVQEQQRREAEAVSAAATAPEPQRLLPAPPTREGPPLGDMEPAELWGRLSAVRSHLAVNPEDVAAQRASELLGQEFSRRVEETAKTATPELAAAEPVMPAAAEPVMPAAAEPVAPAVAEPAAPAAAELTPADAKLIKDVQDLNINFATGRVSQFSFSPKLADRVLTGPPELQAELQNKLIDAIVARGNKPLTKLQEKWGNALDILEDGKLREEFLPEREVPPGVTEGALPAVPVAAEPLAPPAPPPASAAPIKTAQDRAAAINGIQAHIAGLPDSEIKNQYAAEAETVMRLLPNVETNPGLALSLNVRATRLRNQVEAEAQRPADAVATPDLAPSPRAEAMPAPTGDLGAKLEDAQSALSNLRKVLGSRPEVVAAIDQHASWLAEVNKATGPDELRVALAKDPEALAAAETPDVADLGGLTQLSQPQKKQMAAYLSAQERVLQELRAQSDSRARVVASRDGLPVTQLDADVTDLHQRGVPLTDVADHIIEHTPDAETAEIVAKLKPFLPKDAKTVFRDGVTDREGEYFTRQKTSALYNAANATVTSVHEMAHAVMHRALEGDSAAAKSMRGIYDQLRGKGDHAGITDAHEMLSEAMANPTYRTFLKSQMVKGTSLWDRLVDTVRGFIGLDPRLNNAFDRIMSHGDDLMREQRAYPNEWLGPDSYARVANEGTGTAAAAADEGGRSILEKIGNGTLNVKEFMRGIGLGWSSGYWLARSPEYNKHSPNLPEYVNTLAMEDPRRKQIGRAAIVADRQARALPPEGQEILNKVMAASTSYGFHPERSLGDYQEIHGDPTRVQQFKATKDLWNQLGKIPGGQEAYNTWRSTTSALGHMSAVHNLQAVERSIPGLATVDSFKNFDGRSDLTNQPKLSAAYWQKELNDKIKTGTVFRDQLSAQKATIDAELDAIQFKKDRPKDRVKESADLESQIDRLGAAIDLATSEQKRMFKEPYFHLGRKGDFFATGKLVTMPGEIDPETGKPGKARVNQDTLSKFADYLEKHGINDVAIMQGNQHGTFYARVESPAQMAALSKVLGAAQKEGLLAAEPVASGKILDPHIFNRVSSQATQDIIERLRANRPIAPNAEMQPVLDRAHGEQIKDLQRTLMGMTPETSMGRLMAHRQNVPGFSKDMLGSQGYAADVSAFSLARQSLMGDVSKFEAGMLKDLETANGNPDVDANTKLGLAGTIGELMHGQRIRQTFVPKDWKEAARSFTNFLHIGMSPAYVPMQLSSLGITGLPELAKTHGYGQGMAAMTRALSPAMQVLKAVGQSPDGLTAGITREALEKAGLDPTLINKVMGMELRGALGTYTASVSERAPALEGSPLAQKFSSTAMKAANTLGMYSDLAPRLIMGLAADQLYTAKPHPTMAREKFVDHVVNESQGFYGSALGARQTGKGGALGSYTPMMTQFMQWNIHLTNKLYHEVYDAVKGESAQTRQEARTWLKGHAAAVTMLSGTLGLPAVSVAASVYDWFMNTIGKRDDHDIIASYRSFLSNTFGKDMGEIIARGLPRAAGVDFANWGEGEIIPGSASLKIFTEKRKWEDVEKDWFKSIGGPAADQIFQLGLAMRDITNGDYLEGLGRFMPGLVKAPLETYKLATHGFVDARGQKLPISSPRAHEYVLTALGLKPAGKAEYQEVAREVAGLRAMREQSSATISQHLRQAWTRGDQESFNDWMGEAQRWQQRHPGLMPPQASFGTALQNHLRQLSQARGTGLPLGVTPQDIGTRGQFQYGNFPVQ